MAFVNPLRMLRGMKAMVFAAGIGSRLKELTRETPKCLMQAGGKTLLEHVLIKLKAAGVTEVVINTHHLAEKITSYLADKKNFGLTVHISYESSLLDTGGGLRKAAAFFKGEDAFIVHNSDIYCTSDINALVDAHRSKSALATLAVMHMNTHRGLFFDTSMKLVGWTEEHAAQTINARLLAFSGISVCSCGLLDFMDHRDTFSIVDTFLKASRATGRVRGELISCDQWIDIGTPETLKTLQTRLSESKKSL